MLLFVSTITISEPRAFTNLGVKFSFLEKSVHFVFPGNEIVFLVM